ncbi:MAG TPA: hypothetical protein VMZ22_04345 [Acidimicrobiales bacterium]|nr:hypothetical protein [Acidimicrobiales bacterium]
MRRTGLILAFLSVVAALIGIGPGASAHFCSFPLKIDVGKPVTLNVGVAAEGQAVRAVDVEVPDAFELKKPLEFAGYAAERRGKWLHLEGAEIASYSCHYFAIEGQATLKGRMVMRIVTTTADGKRTRYENLNPASQFPAMQIFAGVAIPRDFVADEKRHTPVWVIGAVAVGAALVAVGMAELVRRRVTMGR